MMQTLFPVVILAGGLATRLRPLTETLPKSLLPVNGEPFIFHQLRLLKNKGIQNVVLCLGYLGEMIEAQVGDGSQFGLHVQYVYDGATLRGTGGALKQALPLVDDHFFVLYGDSYLTCDYAAVQTTFLQSGLSGLMTVFCNQGKWDTSNIEYTAGKIVAYDKKNRTERMHHIDYGLGIISKSALASFAAGIFDLAELYQSLLSQQQLAAYEIQERFYETGSFAGIQELECYLRELSPARKMMG